MGRMVNDATSSKINSKMEVVNLNDIPYLCLFAIREIEEGEEILYDYGEKNMHWRKEKKNEESLSHSDVDQDPFDLDKDYVPDTSESGGDGEMDECVITAAASRADPASDPVLQPSPDDSSIPLEQTGSDDSSIPLEQTGSSSMTGRKNYRWTVKDSCVIRERFKQWICQPQGNTLPRKKELMTFLTVSNLQCSFLQLRTKIMNEQNREQKLCKKRWEAFEEN